MGTELGWIAHVRMGQSYIQLFGLGVVFSWTPGLRSEGFRALWVVPEPRVVLPAADH